MVSVRPARLSEDVAAFAPPIALALLLAGCAHAPRNLHVHNDEALAARIEEARSAADLPGIGAAILRGDDLAMAVSGKRRADRPDPVVHADRFHLGSDTKAMTASVVARLVDRGVLRWDTTLGEAMPDAASMDPGFRTVTLDMLMRHTAGLPTGDIFTPEFTKGFDEKWPLERQRAWISERLVSRSPEHPPGARFAYSNYGYLIVGHVLERVTRKSWEDLVREEVFSPLGMDQCGFGPTATDASPDGIWAHNAKDGRYVPTAEDNPPALGPAGTASCSLASWARFAAAHANEDSGGWITPASMHHLHEGTVVEGLPPGKAIALGWAVTLYDPPQLIHTGSNGSNIAQITVIPRLHAAVLVAANAGDERAHVATSLLRDQLVDQVLALAKD